MDKSRSEVASDKYQVTDDSNSDALSELQGAILWPRRSLLYKVSFLALLPLFFVFVLGFTSPFWMKKHQVDKYRGYYNLREKVDVSIGLWRVCEGTNYMDITDCTVIPDVTPYFIACQAMLSLALIFTVFSLLFGLYENCSTRYDIEESMEVRTKRPEMNAILGGLFGLTGVCMYGASIIEAARNDEGAVHWAFPVSAASVTGVIVCGILMAIANPMNAATPSFPGQIMSLSRQESLRGRDANMQDRLVISGDPILPTASAQVVDALYDTSDLHYADRDNPLLLQRSESYLSSHMSSPDLFAAGGQDSYKNRRQAAAVAYDQSPHRQACRQQHQDKAAQRRSWHFDDRNGAYVVTDLIANRPCDTMPAQLREVRDAEVVKPPVPPRLDRKSLTLDTKRVSVTEPSTPTQTVVDLMMLEDPIAIAPDKAGHHHFASLEDVPQQRNTNPFIEDNAELAHKLSDLQRSTLGSEPWTCESWPDLPQSNDVINQSTLLTALSNRSPSDISQGSSPGSTVPESLQYQPQNQTSIQPRKPVESSRVGFNPSDSPSDLLSKAVKNKLSELSMKHQRKRASRSPSQQPEPQILVKKEYDNPVFRPPVPEVERPVTLSDRFPMQVCESTSFVYPSPEQSAAPPFYPNMNITTKPSESPSVMRRNGHYMYSPASDHRDPTDQSSVSGRDKPREVLVLTISRPNSRRVEETASKKSQPSPKERPKSATKPQVQSQSIVIKTRPRQVKRESQQRRVAHPESGLPLRQPFSPSPLVGLYGSSPDLVTRSPKQGHRRPGSVGPGNEPMGRPAEFSSGQSTPTKPMDQKTSAAYGYNVGRQNYKVVPGQFSHWGDSDL